MEFSRILLWVWCLISVALNPIKLMLVAAEHR